jgi:hypothetical protein
MLFRVRAYENDNLVIVDEILNSSIPIIKQSNRQEMATLWVKDDTVWVEHTLGKASLYCFLHLQTCRWKHVLRSDVRDVLIVRVQSRW